MLNALYFPADRSRSKKIEVSVSSIGEPSEVEHLDLSTYLEGMSPALFTVTHYPVTLPIPLDHDIILFHDRHVRNKFTLLICSYESQGESSR